MGIVLRATVPQDGVFFAGELFSCTVTFTHEESINSPKKSPTKINSSKQPDLKDSSPSTINPTTNIGNQSVAAVQKPLQNAISIENLKNLAGSFMNSLVGASPTSATTSPVKPPLPTSPKKPTLSPTRTTTLQIPNDKITRTRSMSGGLNPVVETLGENEDYISEEGSENGKEELTEPLLASELGGKLNLVESNTNRKSITKRQSTILSGVEEINSDATSQIMNQKITPIDTKITHKPKSKSSSIAWAFAQITGQFLVDSNYIELEQFDTLKQKIMYRTPGSAQQGGLGGGGTLSANETDFGDSQKLNSNALPVYNTPPTILFCDEELAVGESKSYTYEILLPPVLPPSHKGRAIRFTYRLLIGVQKNARSRTTQVISVPFRFFNRTNTDGTRPVYEILNPVINNKDDAIVTAEIKSKEFDIPSPFPITPQPGVFGRSNSNMSSNSRIENEFPTSTVDNVSNALQMLGKVSYDISKNNEHVAMLTLPRLGYRLGETITIVLNFGKSSIPCYHVSVFLESYETIEPSFTTKTKQAINNHTKICFGEYHSQTLNSKRTAISLIIPSKGTPDFNSTCVSHQWSLRFEFITGLDSKILATTTALDGYVNQRVMTRVDVAPFDCIIPLKVFGALKMSKQQKQVLEFNLN